MADETKSSKLVNMFDGWIIENWYGKDDDENNPMHYAYQSDMPDIRQILRQSNLMTQQQGNNDENTG